MTTRAVYVNDGTLKLIKLFAINKSQGTVLREAIDIIDTKGFSEADIIDREIAPAKRAVRVDEDTWYMVNRLKIDEDYKKQDDLVFDLMVNYCLHNGLSKDCVERILILE